MVANYRIELSGSRGNLVTQIPIMDDETVWPPRPHLGRQSLDPGRPNALLNCPPEKFLTDFRSSSLNRDPPEDRAIVNVNMSRTARASEREVCHLRWIGILNS